MSRLLQSLSQSLPGLYTMFEDIPLFVQPHLNTTTKVTTSVEVESPKSPSSILVEVEVINESPLPHFNPPLPNTLDFVL